MLQPNNRLTLIDAMRPPAGFGLEAAVAVTFTLDLRALLAAPAAFALSGANTITNDGSELEPIELLHAVRTHASKLTVFSHIGEIALPPSRRVFAFLERSVIPVRAPRGGVVHPKVWLLRYEPLAAAGEDASDERRLRVLIASRNLTFDASWDTVARLDESVDGAGADLGPLTALFRGMLSNASIPVSDDHAARVTALSEALLAARFALPPGIDELQVSVFGLSPPAPEPLPIDVDRSLIISPFVSDDFFAKVRPAIVDELVSRPESLDQLKADSLDCISDAYAFDDGSSVELSPAEERLSAHDPGRPLRGLHAKVFAFEHGKRARVFLGSANATGAAFTDNVEVLLEMEGPVANLGIDRIRGGTGDESALDALFLPYSRSAPATDENELAGLDGARRAIAQLAIHGFVEESGSDYAVTYRSRDAVPALEAMTIYCWPLSSAGNRRQATPGEALEVRFETTIEAISGFLAFEIAHDDGTITQFVVPVPLHDVPEQRERQLLRALVGNAERFLHYLLALLEERAQPEPVDPASEGPSDSGEDPHRSTAAPVLEKLLRTMRRDPGKLTALHPLVMDLAADDALPEGFFELWTTIFDARLAKGATR